MHKIFALLAFGLFLGIEPCFSASETASETAKEASMNTVEHTPLAIAQGEQRILRINGLLRYSLGNPTIVRITRPSQHLKFSEKAAGESLLIKGVLPGAGDLWVWKNDGTAEHRLLRVQQISREEMDPTLLRELSFLDETEVVFTAKGVVIKGEIQSFKEAARIDTLVQGFPERILNETEASQGLLKRCEHQLTLWLQKFSQISPHLRLERSGKILWLRGSLDRPSDKISWIRQAKAECPILQTEVEVLPDYAPTVFFRVFLLELKKNRFQSLGITWPGQTPGAFRVGPVLSQSFSNIDLQLEHLQETGEAKLLSNPELAVRAPGEAELFAGGELPYQITSRSFSDVQWKKYGLTLTLKVSHLAGNKVRLDIQTEVSSLIQPDTKDKLPSISANRMKTQVDAQFGVPLYLSGLLQQGTREEARGLPFLRELPVLGRLFGSKDFQNDQSELVAILYPHLKPPEAPPESNLNITTQRQPKGPVPFPRNWLSPDQQRLLQESKEYPWNALD